MTNRFAEARAKRVFLFCCTIWLSCLAVFGFADAYRLNPGDKLAIAVWGEENLHSEVVVQPDGNISFPLVGQVPAALKTTEELAALLRVRLEKYIPNPELNIKLASADGNAIYVVGEVARPGVIEMKRPIDVMQAISITGGLTAFADKSDIRILRQVAGGKSVSIPFDYSKLEDGENIESNIVLQSGDTIVVP